MEAAFADYHAAPPHGLVKLLAGYRRPTIDLVPRGAILCSAANSDA